MARRDIYMARSVTGVVKVWSLKEWQQGTSKRGQLKREGDRVGAGTRDQGEGTEVEREEGKFTRRGPR